MVSVETIRSEQDRKRILDALDIKVYPAAAMPDDLRVRILANRPSAQEVVAGRWNDDS